MKTILLIDDRRKVKIMLTANFKVYLDVRILAAENWREALEILNKKISDVDGLIVRKMINGQNIEKLVQSFFGEKSYNMVVHYIEPEFNVGESFEEDQKFLKQLIREFAGVFKVTAKDMAKQSVGDFFPIPTENFIHLVKCCCDIYIQQLDKKHETVYGRFIKKDEEIKENIIEELVKQKLKYLYIKSNQRTDFANFITRTISQKLEEPNLEETKKMKLINTLFDHMGNRFEEVDFSEETIEIAYKTITEIGNIALSDQTLKVLLSNLLQEKTSYRYMHTQLIVVFAGLILDKLDWSTLDQRKTIAFAAFFHDIYLNEDKLAKIHSSKELDDAKLSDVQRKIVTIHASLAANAAKRMPKAPMGAIQIIEQHHGSKDGKGFISQFPSTMNMMTRLFLVAEDLTMQFIDYVSRKEKFNRKMVKIMLKEKFRSATFSQILDAVDEIIKDLK